MGYYPSAGEEVLTENCPPGTSFLAKFQQDGEAATAPASAAGIRVVHLRIPAVIGGLALQRAGFRAGNGQQWMSWVGRDELAFIIEFALTTESLSGPVNAVSPNPIRNAEFATISSTVLGQKPGVVMPAFVARLIMGEMGEEFLLASRRIQPAKLLAAGYRFRFPELADTLRHERDCLNTGSVTHVIDKTPVIRT
jgi:NAD dependent epimerase/dehydratase family enzyme